MLYKNTQNLKVVDMCKIFDKEFQIVENRDDTKLFQYLYMIIFATTLREKKGWFNTYEDYDNYAMFAARTLYIRFLKQQREGKKIKSVRNYFRSSMGFLKVMYQKEEFAEIISSEYDDFNSADMIESIQTSLSNDYYGEDKKEEVERLLNEAHIEALNVVKETPYKSDKIMSHRLYLSVLLTFLNSITLNNKSMRKFSRRYRSNKSADDTDKLFAQLLEIEKEQPPILWKLNSSMNDYVRMLVNKMRFRLSNSIRDIQAYYVIPEDVVTSIMTSVYSEGYKDNGKDIE